MMVKLHGRRLIEGHGRGLSPDTRSSNRGATSAGERRQARATFTNNEKAAPPLRLHRGNASGTPRARAHPRRSGTVLEVGAKEPGDPLQCGGGQPPAHR
jgi:hypothetical protein